MLLSQHQKHDDSRGEKVDYETKEEYFPDHDKSPPEETKCL